MSHSPLFRKAKSLIDKHGFLLVFPQAQRETPQSVWSLLYPSTPLRWEWDETADNRVVPSYPWLMPPLKWHLRSCGKKQNPRGNQPE